MKVNGLPEDANALFVMAEDIADVLAATGQELYSLPNSEAALRASVAAARYARDGHLAMVAGATKSAVARRFAAPARNRCNRTEQQLRRRMVRLIAEILLLPDAKDFLNVVDFVLSISA